MENNYLVIGDFVISKKDGQRHYVDAKKLCDLYGIPYQHPKVMLAEKANVSEGYVKSAREKGVIILRPRFDGNYGLNEEGRPF